jgi:hypothetical protein
MFQRKVAEKIKTHTAKSIFYVKSFEFLRLTDFKLLSQIKGNSINDCNFV